MMYDLYGQMYSDFAKSYGQRVFQNVLNNYPVIAFDEFHLYNAKQAANAAFMVGTAKELAPNKPHIFIFSSATPVDLTKTYLERLGLSVEEVSSATNEEGRVVCEPLEINLLASDLMRWKGGDTLRAVLDDILKWADSCTPVARGVFIVDSVYEAKRVATALRQRYPADQVGEVHGYMDSSERIGALRRRFSVGTTTIDVGVDLTDEKSKEFLVCEARSAAQAIQRIGRLGRGGRAPDVITIPNRVWLIVPEYAHEFLRNRLPENGEIERAEFSQKLHSAYQAFENFEAYINIYSPLEAIAACERILKQYQFDSKPEVENKLHQLVSTLYDQKPPANLEHIKENYKKLNKKQYAIWHKYGTPVKSPNSQSKKPKYYLPDLESFRGGMESDFTVAIYDELDKILGLKPIKTYSLPFIVRRTKFTELSKDAFYELVSHNHPAQAEVWLKEFPNPERVLGYVHVTGLIEGQAHEMAFDIIKQSLELVDSRQVMRVAGFSIPHPQLNLGGGINTKLRERSLNCWISEYKSFSVSKNLPPLFAVYPLKARLPNGQADEWSIAFGLDAFFLASLKSKQRYKSSKGTALII